MLCYQVNLYCSRQLGFLSRPWVDCIIGYREQGRDLVFIMYAITATQLKRCHGSSSLINQLILSLREPRQKYWFQTEIAVEVYSKYSMGAHNIV